MPEPLPPFTGDTTTCAKCGHDDARTHYRFRLEAGELIGHSLKHVQVSDREQERLCRECTRCGHHWDEAVAEPEPEGDRPTPGWETARAVRALYSTWMWRREWRNTSLVSRDQVLDEMYNALLGETPEQTAARRAEGEAEQAEFDAAQAARKGAQ